MAQAPLLGELDDSTRLHLAIALPLRNNAQLDVLIEDVSNPRSARYRQYLTPAQVAEQFGPAEQDYQALIEFFGQSDGLTVSNTYANRIVIDVAGNARSIQSVFHVIMQLRRRPDGSEFYAPDREPSLDLDVPVMHITGLDNYILPKAHAGSAPSGSYGGSDFRNAYAPGVTLTGAGQTVALVEWDGFYTADIEKYQSIFGLSVPVQVVTLNGFSHGRDVRRVGDLLGRHLDARADRRRRPEDHVVAAAAARLPQSRRDLPPGLRDLFLGLRDPQGSGTCLAASAAAWATPFSPKPTPMT
jgi:subtilase family serine protease